VFTGVSAAQRPSRKIERGDQGPGKLEGLETKADEDATKAKTVDGSDNYV